MASELLTATSPIADDDDPTPARAEGPTSPELAAAALDRSCRRGRGDSIFQSALLVRSWRKVGSRCAARFDFVLDLS